MLKPKPVVEINPDLNVAYVYMYRELKDTDGAVATSYIVPKHQIVLDFDSAGKLFGIEILDAKRYLC